MTIRQALLILFFNFNFMAIPALGSTLSYEIYNQDIEDFEKIIGFRLFGSIESEALKKPLHEYTLPWTDDMPAVGQTTVLKIPVPCILTQATLEIYNLPISLRTAFKDAKDSQYLEQYKEWKIDTIKLGLPSSNPPMYHFKLTLKRDYEYTFPNQFTVNDPFSLVDEMHNHILLPRFIRVLLNLFPACCLDNTFSYISPSSEKEG